MSLQEKMFLEKLMWLQISNKLNLSISDSISVILRHKEDYLKGKDFSTQLIDCMEVYYSFQLNVVK